MPAAEAGDLVGAVPGVPGVDEAATGDPHQEQPQQAAQDLGVRAVGAAAGEVVGLAAAQIDEHGQRPGAGGEGEADQDGEDDPLVAVPPGGEGVGRADGVAVPGLAVHRAAGVAADGVVADEQHRRVGGQAGDDQPGQGAPQREAVPLSAGQDAA